MKKVLLVLVILVVMILFYIVFQKNSFVRLEQQVNANFAEVDVQLKRRFDLIPNLVETVKGYALHEKDVFKNLADARAKYSGAVSQEDKVKALNEFESALSRLLVIVENYPNLKANESFNKLMDELAGTENRISISRMRYNEAVKVFNTSIQMIPGSLVASMFHYTPKEYLKTPEIQKEAPKVKF